MSSQYYSATAYVGTPHRNAVEVTIPLVGPAGPQGPAGSGGGGDVASVNGQTGVVVLAAADVGAASTSHAHTASAITDLSTSGNAAGLYDNTAGQVGAVVNDFSFRINGDGVSADFDTANLTVSRGYGLPNASGTLALNPMTTAGDLFVGGTSGTPARLALGTASQQLRVNSGATSLEYFTPAAGGTKTYAVFTAEHNQPTATAFATLDTRNSIAVLDFDDTTDESAVFVGIIPEAASLGSGLKIRLHWMATTATSGNVVWDVSLERMTTGLVSDSFDTIASGTAAANGTSGILTVTEITLTTIDSVTAGDGYRLKVTRDANNASDTMTVDAELVVCEVRSAA
jgi:hypothetical protein